MKNRLSPLYALIPALYVGLILLLLYLQLSSGEAFRTQAGALAVSGVYSKQKLFIPGGLKEMRIALGELEFHFDRRRPLLVRSRQGGAKKLELASYRLLQDGVEVSFRQGYELRFTANAQGESAALSARLPQQAAEPSILSLAIAAPRGRTQALPGIPAFLLAEKQGELLVCLPPGSSVAAAASRLEAVVEPGSSRPLVVIDRLQGPVDPVMHWASLGLGEISTEEYLDRLRSYLEGVYRRWLQQESWPEAAAASLLAEALYRGELDKAAQVRRSLRLRPGEIYLTSPYAGNLEAFFQALQSRSSLRIAEITQRLKRSDPSLFSLPGLTPLLLDHGPFSLLEEVLRQAETVSLSGLAVETALGLAETCLDYLRWVEGGGVAASRLREIIDARLLPFLSLNSRGLFLLSARGGEQPLLPSLRAGNLLSRAGRQLAEPKLQLIGKHLVLSALGFADERGVLPRTLLVRPGRLEKGEGELTAEEVYFQVAEDRCLPREIPLYRDLNPGSWLWSACREVRSSQAQDRYRILFSFVPGATHYFLIQGLPAFKAIQLHGLAWKADPRYDSYSDGWSYDGASQTLFGKLTHTREVEELLISF